MRRIDVVKLNPQGEETFRYSGYVLQRTGNELVLEAYFTEEEVVAHKDVVLHRGDRFVEYYYSDRWYNIFEIRAAKDDHLKGWYCNICHPAVVEEDNVSYRDLALDLIVYPDGRQFVLDEDEFEALSISEEVRQQALAGLKELQQHMRTRAQENQHVS